ncbi:MAG: polysaccharide deacetylase family protein [Chromatiales bacterium]|jgi:predicted deacetylase
MAPTELPRAVSVVLHDVAPATWPAYAPLLREIDELGDVPLTLLVVPDYHHGGRPGAHPTFRRAIEARIARGDEIAVHGLYHLDEAPVGPHPLRWLKRRVYTAGEGEFEPLTEAEASERIATALRTFAGLGWPVSGFVAPAWLVGPGARAALRRSPFRYTSTPSQLIRLPDWEPIAAPSLVWSARSGWRRRLSRLWNERLLEQSRSRPLLRLGLHPVDMGHPEVVRWWLGALQRALREPREPMTKARWVQAWR